MANFNKSGVPVTRDREASGQTTAERYIANPNIVIEGIENPPDLMKDILKIVVEESLHLPAMFAIVLHNNYIPVSTGEENQPWRHQQYLEIGKTLKIGFKSSTSLARDFSSQQEEYLIEGEITAIDVNFTGKSESHVIIRGYDCSHRLHQGRHNRSFENMTDSDIVKKIARETNIPIGQCDRSGAPRDYTFQENQTNMEFLQRLAGRNGFELFVRDGKLYFRKPNDSEEILNLKWLRDINSFDVRVSSAQQVSGVEVRGWDYEDKRVIIENHDSADVITRTNNGMGRDTAAKFSIPAPKEIVVDRPVFKAEEAKVIAKSLCDELGGEFVCADARADKNGNPKIRPGRRVKLDELGPYSGTYYITATCHTYYKKVYSTNFSVRGLRGGDLLTALTPQRHLQPSQTLVVGIVTNNKDPKGWGRVRVKLPTLTEAHESNWARVVNPGAGQDRGLDCLPEVNDEVLVGFEHGDIHRPYIIGNVWNGRDPTPERVEDSVQKGKVRLRVFKSRRGHLIRFVDEDKGDSKTGIYVETAGGHRLSLNDSDRCIEIETTNGHTLMLDDSGQSIRLQSTGDLAIEAKGTIAIKGTKIYLN